MLQSLLSHAVVAAVFFALGYVVMRRKHNAYRAYNRSILQGLQMVNNLPSSTPPASIDAPAPRSSEFVRPMGVPYDPGNVATWSDDQLRRMARQLGTPETILTVNRARTELQRRGLVVPIAD